MIDRIPPQNIEAEQSVLGAMLVEKRAVLEVTELLQPEDFYRQDNRVIFEAILSLYKRSEAVDMVTVTEELKQGGKLDAVGGIAAVTALSLAVPTAANAKYHAEIVKRNALRRQLISVATEIAADGYESEDDVNIVLDKAEQKILQVANRKNIHDFSAVKDVVKSAMERVEQLYDNGGVMTGLQTGFTDFDRITAGLQPSDLIIIAARPSMGKSTIVLNMMQNIAIRGKGSVAFFSLEMSKEQLVQRMLCAEANIDSARMRVGELQENEWPKLITAADKISQAKIFLDDTAGITAMEMRSKARRLKQEQGLDLVVVDYLQLMQGNSKRSNDNRQQEISDISRSLKGLARELNVPVIALSQLSRSVESRQIKRPMLSDLRESGALEQDADIVAFLYREDYYDKETENQNITELIIAKHRNGPTDTIKLFFQKETTRFRNLSKRE